MNNIQSYLCAATDAYRGVVDPQFISLAQHFSRMQQPRAAQRWRRLGGLFSRTESC